MTHAPPAPSPTKRWLRALEMTGGLDGEGAPTFPDLIEAGALRHGDRPALLSDAECLTYAGLAARSNRYSRWALSLGLPPGSAVALLMPNSPDYLAAWIGITRAGLAAALLNTGLVGTSLAHCVAVAEPAHALVHASLAGAWAGAVPHLAPSPPVSLRGEAGFDDAFDRLSGDPLDPAGRPRLDPAGRALLIYTSGTTGLPKAAVVSHRRITTWSLWFAGLAGIGPDDRIYDALPLFHSVGGVVAPGCVLAVGGSAVIAPRFSASAFWPDVERWGCTLFQYIGELCRTLLAAARDGAPPPHRLRLALGNGLRPDVWEAFRDRFAIPEILEFYAATEGSFSLSNVEGRVGAIGRVPPFLAHRFPVAVLRFDVERNAPVRGEDGLCIRAAAGEAGEAVGLIGAAEGASREGAGRFEGYTAQADGDAKVLRDVFTRGDRWFRTGDLMRRDAQGFFFFVDRIGDTFRWCGENVATTEVAEALTGAPGVADATVYGVGVPRRDGRAGMAALVVGEGFSLPALARHLAERLPAYARPVFLRLQSAIGSTDTFKHRKAPLVRDGFDPAAITDPLFAWDREGGAYVPLDAGLFSRIEAGTFRL